MIRNIQLSETFAKKKRCILSRTRKKLSRWFPRNKNSAQGPSDRSPKKEKKCQETEKSKHRDAERKAEMSRKRDEKGRQCQESRGTKRWFVIGVSRHCDSCSILLLPQKRFSHILAITKEVCTVCTKLH